jgi:hypothetical protein
VNWQVVFRRVANRCHDVIDRARPDDPQRPQLVNARIARVQLSENVVAADVALQHAAQVFLNSLLLWIHGDPYVCLFHAKREGAKTVG